VQEWCTEHPWMTFFIVIAALNALRGLSLITVKHTRKDKT
jgi:hypothetical protein